MQPIADTVRAYRRIYGWWDSWVTGLERELIDGTGDKEPIGIFHDSPILDDEHEPVTLEGPQLWWLGYHEHGGHGEHSHAIKSTWRSGRR
jgi:hypothetical protein